MYKNGKGVARNYVQAYKWLNLSAAQGNDWGRRNREWVLKRMTPAQIAEGQKLSHQFMERTQKE
jgi:TPR repeat protein